MAVPAYVSIPGPGITEEKIGDPIEITFSIQKYNIPSTDPGLNFIDKNKAFPLFDIVDGVTQYLNKLSNTDDVGFILKSSKSYARATKKPNVVNRVQSQPPPIRTHWTLEDIEATRKNAFSPFRLRRKKLPKSGKKVGKKSDKKSGKVRKNKRKTTL